MLLLKDDNHVTYFPVAGQRIEVLAPSSIFVTLGSFGDTIDSVGSPTSVK